MVQSSLWSNSAYGRIWFESEHFLSQSTNSRNNYPADNNNNNNNSTVSPVRRHSLDTHSILTIASMNVDADHVIINMPLASGTSSGAPFRGEFEQCSRMEWLHRICSTPHISMWYMTPLRWGNALEMNTEHRTSVYSEKDSVLSI